MHPALSGRPAMNPEPNDIRRSAYDESRSPHKYSPRRNLQLPSNNQSPWDWEFGPFGSSHPVTVPRTGGTLRLFMTRGATIEIDHRRKRIRRPCGQAVFELCVRAGRRGAARGHTRGRRRSARSVPVSMCRHRGLLIGRKQKGHHPVADDGPWSILNLCRWLHHPLALRPPILARPSSRLLSRTARRTTAVFSAQAGSDTENVDARDIVEGRVAEIGGTCQLPMPSSQLPRRVQGALGVGFLGVGRSVSARWRSLDPTALRR
jgi:hypothetical protein